MKQKKIDFHFKTRIINNIYILDVACFKIYAPYSVPYVAKYMSFLVFSFN